jgi:protein TonB
MAAVISFGLQMVVLGAFVLLPLVYTDALPLGALKEYVEIPPPPGRAAPPAQQPATQHRPRPTELVGTTVIAPSRVPLTINHVVDDPNETPPGLTDGGVVGIPNGVGRGSALMDSLVRSTTSNVAPPPPPHPVSVRLSGGVTEGLLIQKITPTYPRPAILIRQQGTVLLQATIGRDGTIQNLHAISGPPLLIKPALDAVRQWRYRPYLLNNEPVEVETQITVNFTLGG